jgi:hypothetical protein
MANDRMNQREQEREREPGDDGQSDLNRDDDIRRLLDEQGDDANTFNPRTGEDPGLLPLTEDPQERRVKRTTM